MTAIPLTLYPTRPAEEATPEVTEPVMVELDQIRDSGGLLVRGRRPH